MKKFRFFSVAVAIVAVLFVSVWAATGSAKLVSGTAMGVAGIPVGTTACSNKVFFNFTTPPTNATITKMEVGTGTLTTNKGAFTTDYLQIECNYPQPPNNVTKINWGGAASTTLSTQYFNGQPARIQCYVSFCGKCVGGYMEAGQMVNMCNKSYTNVNMTVYYQY